MTKTTYGLARERYAEIGVDTEAALQALSGISISLPCWQGDDVGGFETGGRTLAGGIAVTGAHRGKARSLLESRADLEKALSLIPGLHRVNVHASYAELGGRKIERTDYTAEHFQEWIDWCRAHNFGFDFNPTYFSHPLAADGFTLSHRDNSVRQFWIDHGIACRRIAAEARRQLGGIVVTNFWIPDGYKDLPADRKAPRERLTAALDEIFTSPEDHGVAVDSLESKLFGIGCESYVVGSHEFYLGYAISRKKLYCLDSGHFHPTESVDDKISAMLSFLPGIILHLSRGVRWDSDHVALFDDTTRGIMREIVRGNFLPQTHLCLDSFDASINRVAAWIIGARAALQALLFALLEPRDLLMDAERCGDFTARLALQEAAKFLPFAAVWEEHCQRLNAPSDLDWLDEVRAYERTVLTHRD